MSFKVTTLLRSNAYVVQIADILRRSDVCPVTTGTRSSGIAETAAAIRTEAFLTSATQPLANAPAKKTTRASSATDAR